MVFQPCDVPGCSVLFSGRFSCKDPHQSQTALHRHHVRPASGDAVPLRGEQAPPPAPASCAARCACVRAAGAARKVAAGAGLPPKHWIAGAGRRGRRRSTGGGSTNGAWGGRRSWLGRPLARRAAAGGRAAGCAPPAACALADSAPPRRRWRWRPQQPPRSTLPRGGRRDGRGGEARREQRERDRESAHRLTLGVSAVRRCAAQLPARAARPVCAQPPGGCGRRGNRWGLNLAAPDLCSLPARRCPPLSSSHPGPLGNGVHRAGRRQRGQRGDLVVPVPALPPRRGWCASWVDRGRRRWKGQESGEED